MTAVVSNTGEISHQPCPYEECGSSDAFAYNVVTKIGHCHSCKRNYPGRDPKFSWAEDTYPMPEKKPDLRNTKIITGRFDDLAGPEEMQKAEELLATPAPAPEPAPAAEGNNFGF